MGVLYIMLMALAFAPVSTALSQSLAAMDATALVRRAVQNRLDAEKNHRLVRYVLHRTDEHHDTTKEIIETVDGYVARLIKLDGKPLLVVNGTQTLSHGYAAAFDDLAPLQAAGVTHFRLSPQTTDMVKVASLFRAALDGRIAAAEAQAELAALVAPTPFVDGYMRGRAGMSFSGGAAMRRR